MEVKGTGNRVESGLTVDKVLVCVRRKIGARYFPTKVDKGERRVLGSRRRWEKDERKIGWGLNCEIG